MAFRTNKVPAIEERTVSGSSVSFNSAFALPLKACKVSFSATQAGSGDPSPSNPRAISGVSAIGLTANSTPVSVSLGDTRYGGELDLLTGILSVTHVIMTIDGSETWTYRSASDSVYHTQTGMKAGKNQYGMSDIFPLASDYSAGVQFGNNNATIYINELTSFGITGGVEGFKTFAAQNNFDVLYPLAEPITIQLSANELSSIIGNNTFSTDTGTLEITFADLQEKSASGAVASFNTALAMPLVNGEFTIQAYQEGTGDPSPVNVRNIVPRREVNIYQRGINLWDEVWEFGDIDNTTGEDKPAVNYFRSTNYNRCVPNTNYCITLSAVRLFWYDQNKNYISSVYTNSDTFVAMSPNNAFYFKLKKYSLQIPYANNISINYPSSDTSYHAYDTNSNDKVVNLGEDTYGAVYNSVTGRKDNTHVKVVYDGSSDEDWGSIERSGVLYYYLENAFDMNVRTSESNPICLCNIYKEFTGISISTALPNVPDKSFCNQTSPYLKRLWIIDRSILSVEDLRTALASQPLEISYPIATPTETQLEPTPINTFIGNNTIFADTGDVDLTYKDLDIAKRGNFREVFKLPS